MRALAGLLRGLAAAWTDTQAQLVGIGVNQLKAMSNRAGKREREARRRHKRGRICHARTVPPWSWVKLGRRKIQRSCGPLFSTWRERGMAAIPVDDSRTAPETHE